MAEILSLALPFFGLIFLGLAGGFIFKGQGSLDWLNTFVIYFALPALFFKLIATTPFGELANLRFIGTTTLVTFCTFVIAFIVGLIATRNDLAAAAIQGGLGAYGNIGYLGPGLALAALGPAATVPTALIVCCDSALIFVIVPLIMAFAGRDAGSLAATLYDVARRVLTHPFIVATVLGILAAYIEVPIPGALDRLLTMLSGAAAPCALFAMGVRIAQRPLKRIPREMPVLISIKLLLHPSILALALAATGSFERTWALTALLLAALPPAANVFVLAQQYEVYVERASSTIMIGTFVSVPTVTALLYLISAGYV